MNLGIGQGQFLLIWDLKRFHIDAWANVCRPRQTATWKGCKIHASLRANEMAAPSKQVPICYRRLRFACWFVLLFKLVDILQRISELYYFLFFVRRWSWNLCLRFSLCQNEILLQLFLLFLCLSKGLLSYKGWIGENVLTCCTCESLFT